jgi:hypothetical protein
MRCLQMQAMQAAGRGMPQGQVPQMGFTGFPQPHQQMMGGFAPTQPAPFQQYQQQPGLAKTSSGKLPTILGALGRASSESLDSLKII